MDIYEKQLLFQQQFPALYQFAYRYVALRIYDALEVEDVAALSCTEAYAQLKKYDAVRGSLQQWLTGILRFKVIDYWRQKKLVVSLEEAETVIDEYSTARNTANTIDEKMAFAKIMKHLPHEIRLLFTLRYIDDLTYEDIANIVGKKATTVRKLFSDTHKKLREQFSEEFLGEI